MTSIYYKPSGRVPFAAIPTAILYATSTLPVAWFYAWLTTHIPVIFTILLALGFSLWMGVLAKRTATQAKVRNPAWMARCGVGIALTGWYFHWAAWIALINHIVQPAGQHPGEIFLTMAMHPIAMVKVAFELMKVGTWNLGGERITGGVLAAFWLAELLILVAFPRMIGRMRAEDPFCEASNTWANEIEVPRKFAYIDEPHTVLPFLEKNPDQLLGVLAPWSERISLSHTKVILYRCEGADSYISIRNVVAAFVKGKMEEDAKIVVQYLHLPGIHPDELISELTEAIAEQPGSDGAKDRPTPSELEAAVEHLNAEQYEAAFNGAAPFVNSSDMSLRTDANRLCGLTSSRLGRWEEAIRYWDALFDDEPTAHNALQVASSSVMDGKVERGMLWMERARALNATSKSLPGFMIETNFITALSKSGQMLAAMPYLEQIKKFYISFKITDPTILFSNRYPLFESFLANSAPIIRATLDFEQGRSWYIEMLPHLDDRGKIELNEWMKEQFQTT
jgi:tetratricopeptide (TPR) repeat protein